MEYIQWNQCDSRPREFVVIGNLRRWARAARDLLSFNTFRESPYRPNHQDPQNTFFVIHAPGYFVLEIQECPSVAHRTL